jgi:PAS domain S-box-containing protein
MELWKHPVFQSLIRSLEECVLALDQAGRVVGAHCPVDALPEREIAGKTIEEVFPPEVAAAFRVALRSLALTALPQTVNYRLDLADRRRHFSARLASPEVGGREIIVAIWDVTRQVLAHQSMLESEAFYRLLAENSSDVIAVESVAGEYLYISPGVSHVLGLDVDEVVGHRREEFLHPDDIARWRGADGPRVPPPEGGRVRFRARHADGRWIWMESTIRAFEWEGRPALISTARDITARHEAEAELREARQRAEMANRAKSGFLASISHDLRTPLHGILGMSELMAQTHLTPEQQEYLGAIQESGDTLLARLNDLLDLSKIESGNLDLQDADFDLVEAVEGLVDILGNQAAAKGINLFCHVPPEVPPVVRGDPQRLRQVLINLIDNAIKHTSNGEVDVRAGLAVEGWLRFTVKDTGPHLGTEQLDRILGREPTGERPRWRPNPGAGLGLLIGRQLIELMGGELQVTSSEAGTVFSFELPMPVAERSEPVAVQASLLAGKRVLATDDNATNRQLIREYLEQAGAEVELTSGGVETIRNLLDDPAYHCVVLNANLPDLDGFATAAMIRSNRTLEKLPLVLMISSAHSEEVERSRELAVNATLTKPVRRDVLVRAVHDVVTSGEHRDEAGMEGQGTVLVVEDNDVNLRLARDILRRAGYGVVSARDGTEALRQLELHSIDAVLMDIQLPDMDGLEATARIRRTDSLARIPIIAMTAHAMKGDAERFLDAGIDDYLSKPVNRLELLGCLDRELSKRRAESRA